MVDAKLKLHRSQYSPAVDFDKKNIKTRGEDNATSVSDFFSDLYKWTEEKAWKLPGFRGSCCNSNGWIYSKLGDESQYEAQSL